MNNRWQRAGQRVKPGFKIAGKLVLLTALRYGPAGVRPLKMLLGLVLEPVLSRAAAKLSKRYSGNQR